MEEYQTLIQQLSLALGASWASGINLYAAMLVLGLSATFGGLDLPAGLDILANPLVLLAAAIMYVVEFITDKIPGVDSVWDAVHTFIRIPAGALMAAGVAGDGGMVMELAGLILGGGMATASHATKAGSRVLLNTSPEPLTNWSASVTEDIAVFGGLWAALNYPLVFLGLLFLFILLMAWLLPKIWRGIRAVFSFLTRKGGGHPASPPHNDAT